MILQLFHGFCMALADSVPGVSGGTVAFILGFYERLLNAVHDLAGTREERKQALRYLAKLGMGWVIGMVLSILALSTLLQTQVYFLSSLFLGLTAASIPFIMLAERETLSRGRMSDLLYLVFGVLLVSGMSFGRSALDGFGSLDYMNLSVLQYAYLFVSGMLAITAMVLPGISGSTLLLIFGVYLPTISAIHEFLHFNFVVAPGLFALGFGILFGAASSVKVIRRAFKEYRTHMLYFIIGLMIGSFYAIIMGPTTLGTPKPPVDMENFSMFGFALGIVILLGLEKLKRMTAEIMVEEYLEKENN